MRKQPRFWSAWLCVVLLLTMLLPVSLAHADGLSEQDAVTLLQHYRIVRGHPGGDLGLGQRLTRAQAAALFVRSMGAEERAKLLAGSSPFSDARGHWAAGEITMAQVLGLMQGDGNGLFRPEDEITYVELYTVLLRMVGREPAGRWDPAMIMVAAMDLKLVPAGISALDPAQRGKFFWSLATALQIPLPSGKTLLQTHVDAIPPGLTLDRSSVTTTDSSVQVAGTARDAWQVLVNAQKAALDRTSGRFTLNQEIAIGTHTLTVVAVDAAGNKSEATFAAERRPVVSRIEISGPANVQAGSSLKLDVRAYDPQNRPTPLTGLQVQLTGDVATFDLNTQTLQVANKTGSGRLTIRNGNVSATYAFTVTRPSDQARELVIKVNNDRPAALGKDTTVTVEVVDMNGHRLTDDYWRTITLTANDPTVVVTEGSARTQAGQATFTVRSFREGQTVFTARSSGLPDVSHAVLFLPSTRVVLTASPATLRPDGEQSATITATLQDENGRVVSNNSGTDLVIDLHPGNAISTLSNPVLVIRRGQWSSQGTPATLRAGFRSEVVTLTGQIRSGQSYGVQSLTLPVTGALPGVKLLVTYPTGRINPGAPVDLTIQVLDSANRRVTTGSYAFQLTLATSNGEPVTGGLPDGIQVAFPNSAYRPVDDGRAPGDPLNDANAVIGRTYQGLATVRLQYSRSGIVTVTPRLLPGTDNAYHPSIGFGPASPSQSMSAQPFQLTFAGAPAGLRLTADSALGREQPGAAAGAARTFTLRAQVVDATGMPVPGFSDWITLERVSGSQVTSPVGGVVRKAAVDGKAEFTLQSSASVGFDLYRVRAGGLSSQPITVSVRNQAADRPTIIAVRGVKEGDPSPVTGYVGPDADYLEIQLAPQAAPVSGEPTHWVQAKVYRKGQSSPFFTSGAIDLRSPLPVVRVPKANLTPGAQTYEVVLANGAGDSARSLDQGYSTALNAIYNASFRITSAMYDAQSAQLHLFTGSLASGGSFDLTKLAIVKGNHRLSLDNPAVAVSSRTGSVTILDLGALAAAIDPEVYNGAVSLQATDGWFHTADGSQVARASADALLKPSALITHASIDVGASRLYLHGAGLAQGQLALDKIKFSQGTQVVGMQVNADRAIAISDTQVTIALSAATVNALKALPDLHLTAEIGWLRVTSSGRTFTAPAITQPVHKLYQRVAITSAYFDGQGKSIILRCAGLAGATINPAKLAFRASDSTALWRPASTPSVVATEDTQIAIRLSDADFQAFRTRFGNRSVFVNTDTEWFLGAHGWWGAPVPTDSVLFYVPAT